MAFQARSSPKIISSNLYFETGASETFTLQVTGGGDQLTWSLISGPSDVSIDQNGTVSWSTPTAGTHPIVVQVTDQHQKSSQINLEIRVASEDICIWNGSTSTNYNTAANWSFCGGNVPGRNEWICIPDTPENQPLLDVGIATYFYTQGFGFCASSDSGGELTVKAGSELRMKASSMKMFQSDVKLKGETSNCTTCIVSSAIVDARDTNVLGNRSRDTYISNGATLTLKSGILLGIWNHSYLFVGDGATSGHLVAEGGSTQSEWPYIQTTQFEDFTMPFGHGNRHWNAVVVQGASRATKSSIDIKGLNIHELEDHHLQYYGVTFLNHYQVKNLDDLHLIWPYDTGFSYKGVQVENCSNAIIDDLNWANLDFNFVGTSSKDSINSNCDFGYSVAVEELINNGGAAEETDPNNNFDWY